MEYKYLGQGEYYNRALAAYFRSAYIDRPSNGASGEYELNGLHYVVLRNVNRVLAVYRVKNDGYLRGLKRWPKEFEEW